ncbi:MAG TPA: prolipoprotein diacylglyceryl transferase family protein [Bacteroidia bacterium]|nr:prolipoprotein diacylglyceryl transferase family protein [Bacteroidia bacterium]
MYPTISDLLKDLFGFSIPLPIQSFGFMLAISFLLATYTLMLEFKRKEKEGHITFTYQKFLKGAPATTGELITSGIFGFIIGYKLLYVILNYSEFVNDTQGFILSAKGNFIGGIALAIGSVYLRYSEKKKQKLAVPEWVEEKVYPHQLVGNFTMVAAVSGLIGAKIFHNLENLDEFEMDPLGSLISFSGLTMYGGLICGGIAMIWYAKKKGIPVPHFIDSNATGLMLAYGVGRLGCQISGDGDWGIANPHPKPSWLNFLPDWAWAYNYPHNVNGVGIPIPGCEGKHCMMLPEVVYPTPLWEAVICIFLFFVLWNLRKKITVPGLLFCIYLIMNGVERFFIEKIRVNTKYHILGHAITQAEIISCCLVVLGIIGILYFRKNKMQKAA